MLSKIYPLKLKLLLATKEGNIWRIRRNKESNPQIKAMLILLIEVIDDYKDRLKKELDELEKPS